MQEELIDIEELQIKGELVGMENESFDDKTAFVFDEENTIEIINKISLLIGLDNSQNNIIKSIKEIIASIQTSVIEIKEKDIEQDTFIDSLQNDVTNLNSLIEEIQKTDFEQNQNIKAIDELLDALQDNLNIEKEKITSLEDKVKNIPTDVTDFSDYITSLQETLGIYEESYSNQKTYEIGAIEVHNHKVVECIEPITTPEEFNSSKWFEVPLLIEEEEE